MSLRRRWWLFSPEKCSQFGIIWAKSVTHPDHCFPFIGVWICPFNITNWSILVLVRGLFQKTKTQNSSYKECYFSHSGANLVILSTFVLKINWAKLATKYGPISSFLKAWNGSRRANVTIQTHHFNPLKNQNYPPFFQNNPFVSSFRLPYTGLFLPCLLGPKGLYSTRAKLDPKIVLCFTHRNGPMFRSKTDLFDLQCTDAAPQFL